MFKFCGKYGKATFNKVVEQSISEQYKFTWLDKNEEEDKVLQPKKPTIVEKEINDKNVIISDARREGVREAIVVDSNLKINIHRKTEEDILNIKNAISSNEFLETVLKENFLEDIIDAMYPLEVKDGDIIIQEGDLGDHLYISDSGTYQLYTNNILIKTFNDQRVFGELALLYNNKRAATVKAITNGKLWMLQRKVFQQTLVRDAVKYLEETFSFLKHVPLVNKLNDDKLNKIANLLKTEFFKTNTVIVQENDEGDKFYIIRAGSVTVTKEGDVKLGELTKGDFFGERALLHAEKSEATVTAEAPGVECLTLTRSEFKEHFDEKILTEPASKKIEEIKPCQEKIQRESEHSDIELNNLKIVDTLGVGGFGRVLLVQHKTQHNLTFALKYLKKYEMVQRDQIEHVNNEKALQIQCDSTFITRLYKTFHDRKYLYFLTETCLGGDLWSHIQKRTNNKFLPEQDAKFYSACALEALAYLHERNIVYRDLKPENLLIDNKGYLKLTDMGFAKHLEGETKTFTFAGTPEYVAPEIIYNRGHNRSVDYWAYGILIFELLVGRTPFGGGEDHMKIYNRILRGINSAPFPPIVSQTAVSIIVKLCRGDPNERLGAQKNGVDDIRNHKWFSGFNWNKLRSRKIKAPFVPKLKSNIDTKYFEKFKIDDDIPPDELIAFESF